MSQQERFTKLSFEAMVSNLTCITDKEKQHISEGLAKIPIKKIIDLSQYITNIILPQVNKNKGPDSMEYKNFKGVSDALIWALHVMSLQDRTLYELSNQKLLTDFYQQKTLFYQKELLRYTTMDDLLMQETFSDLKNAMIQNEAARQSSIVK